MCRKSVILTFASLCKMGVVAGLRLSTTYILHKRANAKSPLFC